MPILISARENNLVGAKRPWRFHTRHDGIVDFDRLVDVMAKARTTLSRPDILATLTLFSEIVTSLVADGKFVKTPLGDYYLTAVGKVLDASGKREADSKDAGPKVRLRFRPARDAERAMSKAVSVRREAEGPQVAPRPLSVLPLDGAPSLGPGGTAKLIGKRLAFNADDPAQGVFLIASDRTTTRCSSYLHLKPSLVIFRLPETLATGAYTLELRGATRAGTQRSGGLADGVEVS
ncbi:MAG TPA: DUF4469 domain-containing protein [Rectinemataceae bacterium]|nr:DUF4469 domain-containing protein [Rectinemataceae bacterium]